MTLTELAKKLREALEFNWLTYDRRGEDWYQINLWKTKPIYKDDKWCPRDEHIWSIPQSIEKRSIRRDIELDLSEYPDVPITNLPDYSKCIVEVE